MGDPRKEKYSIVIHNKAEKNLGKIPFPWQKRIAEAVEILKFDPCYGEKLWGELSEYRKIRVWPYRIIYRIYEREKLIYIAHIEHRQGVYK